jgi:hypothetical protein
MSTEYRLDLYRRDLNGDWKLCLTERFDAPFTAEVLPMVTHETGFGSHVLTNVDD